MIEVNDGETGESSSSDTQRVRVPSVDVNFFDAFVGVVGDLGMSPREPEESKGLYHPAAPREMPSGFMAMRVGGNAGA
ncbi:MAG: hypothetical protein ACRD2A_01685 [Vicinamibacterales bacterium]